MRQPYVNFRELKAAVPIRRVLERYGLLESLKEKGGALSGPCPLCEGETSFRANAEKNCFHCFGCRAGGNMLDLVAALEDCSVRDAAVRVAEWFEVETSRPGKGGRAARPAAAGRKAAKAEPPPAAAPEPGPVPAGNAAAEQTGGESAPPEPSDGSVPPDNRPLTFELKLDPHHPWFAGAGLLPETVAEFGLGFCARGVMGGRIAFPIRNARGELVGYAGRWPDDEPPEGQPLWRYPKGLDLSQVVYPAERLHEVRPDHALFASDPLRVVLCWQLGARGVFFVPSAGSMEEQLRALRAARE